MSYKPNYQPISSPPFDIDTSFSVLQFTPKVERTKTRLRYQRSVYSIRLQNRRAGRSSQLTLYGRDKKHGCSSCRYLG